MAGQLVVMVGLPGSGKTTMARMWRDQCPDTRVMVSRDDLRTMLFGRRWNDGRGEADVTLVQLAAVRALLTRGRNVIIHDTNLRPDVRQQWIDLAAECSTSVQFWDLRHVPAEVCIARQATRPAGEAVPEEAIRAMAAMAGLIEEGE